MLVLPEGAICARPHDQADGTAADGAFAVIRETIREMGKFAIGRVVLTNREHIIAREPLDKGLTLVVARPIRAASCRVSRHRPVSRRPIV